ncbi:MAG TPA: 16S rRNA (guanine(966)-N(2))-methyltransferase RsmD, partial [Candidatus Saccharimonadales bacterium]|nr:16S rRNA (guanine(966)-N(2))-methyltransferase RsmD [Candidatus Saccharimonadales bacterium]
MALRVLGGELRGRPLFGGRGRAVRPTLGQVREALFGILGERVRGVAVLDVFAGSGALAIEALSRGAARAVLLERDAQALRVVRRNLEALELTGRAEAVLADACRWVDRHPVRDFEIIFLDPPYAGPEGPAVLSALGELELHPDALVTWEYPSRAPAGAPERVGRLERAVDRRYGDTGLAIYRTAGG